MPEEESGIDEDKLNSIIDQVAAAEPVDEESSEAIMSGKEQVDFALKSLGDAPMNQRTTRLFRKLLQATTRTKDLSLARPVWKLFKRQNEPWASDYATMMRMYVERKEPKKALKLFKLFNSTDREMDDRMSRLAIFVRWVGLVLYLGVVCF